MKKTLCILLAVLMITALFSGCGEPEPLRIVVDLEYSHTEYSWVSVEEAAKGFALRLAEAGGPTDVIIECIPGSFEGRTARNGVLTNLKAEIMAGGGPDVFIMGCHSNNDGNPFFAMPEQAMANGLFLPLDEYIEDHAQFTDWDKLQPQVMEAGRDAYGQQIVPVSYTLPLTVFREEDVPQKYPKETTWQDMLDDKTGVLSAASTWYHANETMFSCHEGAYLENLLGPLADYNSDELLFTEDELLQCTLEVLEQQKRYRKGEFANVSPHYQMQLCVNYDLSASNETYSWAEGMNPYNGIMRRDALTMIPLYSRDGGVTATVASYAAVNVNTKRPEDAFAVIDYLLSPEEMQCSLLGWNWLYENAVPTHMDAMSTALPIVEKSFGTSVWFMSEENFEEFSRVREQITHARFRGGLDWELDDLYMSCQGGYVYDMKMARPIEEYVHEYYRRMQRMLGE